VAEQALEATGAELERYAPEKERELRAALDDAHTALEEGRYTDALRAAQALPARIHSAQERVRARRAALGADWEELSRTVPASLGCLRSHLARLAVLTTPPPETWLSQGRAELRGLERAWDEVRRILDRGDLAAAVDAARDTEGRAAGLGERLGASGC
jgi:hypothetical protein